MSRNKDLRKAAEECSELATVLIQQLNKPHKDCTKHIIEEIGDVLFRVNKLSDWYDETLIRSRVEYKRVKEIKKNEK